MPAFQFEDFGAPVAVRIKPGQLNAPMAPDNIEELKLEAFESGYKAGWDDAAKAAGEDQSKAAADFSHNLSELSFTFLEARQHVLKAIEPLFLEVLVKLLPQVAQESLMPRLLELMNVTAAAAADQPFEIVIAPGNRDALEALLPDPAPFPLEIREEPSLAEGQAYLSHGSSTTQVDLETARAEMSAAISDFFRLQHEEAQNEQSFTG